ncbi:MAG: hypothetical protein RRA32_09895 [bacterium]|nr:hypothetical protein [bacterium]
MLKAFEDLEKAVIRFLDREEARKKSSPGSRGRPPGPSGGDNEEAAELIRRAIKRLKSL